MAESTEQQSLDLSDSQLNLPKSDLIKSNSEQLNANPLNPFPSNNRKSNISDLALRHSALCDLIARFDHEYYALDAPSVPDSEYDKVYAELQSLESLHPTLITPESPTQRVSGSAINAFNSITHRQAMLSLNNAFEESELEVSMFFSLFEFEI